MVRILNHELSRYKSFMMFGVQEHTGSVRVRTPEKYKIMDILETIVMKIKEIGRRRMGI